MPRAYYNENDPFAAAWLRNLIQANLIAAGDVDTRDIRDVRPVDLAGYTQHHFFAGIGGWSLALRLAHVPDDRPLWTGSCPCQPFSAAGKRGGFADERHLWPYWHWLIEQCRPSVVFGEQVASAADWLRLVRGDLEALGYAVGTIPVEAASAGADHLRDRFWFVADDQGERWREGRTEHAVRSGWNAAPGNGGAGNDMAHHHPRSQGRNLLPERPVERLAGTDGLANTKRGLSQRRRSAGEFPGAPGEAEDEGDQRKWSGHAIADPGERVEWVIGADGKARRVKSGVRLLVDGFPNRVGLLRGFGNAIDPRPAAAFIRAAFS